MLDVNPIWWARIQKHSPSFRYVIKKNCCYLRLVPRHANMNENDNADELVNEERSLPEIVNIRTSRLGFFTLHERTY